MSNGSGRRDPRLNAGIRSERGVICIISKQERRERSKKSKKGKKTTHERKIGEEQQ